MLFSGSRARSARAHPSTHIDRLKLPRPTRDAAPCQCCTLINTIAPFRAYLFGRFADHPVVAPMDERDSITTTTASQRTAQPLTFQHQQPRRLTLHLQTYTRTPTLTLPPLCTVRHASTIPISIPISIFPYNYYFAFSYPNVSLTINKQTFNHFSIVYHHLK